MDKKTLKLVEAVEELHALLGSDGAYAISRHDREMMGWVDIMIIGGVIVRIDDAIAALKEGA